jgi:phosphatidylglycerophosphate synthase
MASQSSRTDGVTAFLTALSDVRIWGMTGTERAERLLRRLGFDEIVFAGEASAFDESVFLLRADALVDEKLLAGVQARQNCVLVTPMEHGYVALAASASHDAASDASRFLQADAVFLLDIEEAGLTPLQPDDLGGHYSQALRKRARPTAALLTAENVRRLHWETFAASYKGVTDLVTKFVWPHIAFPITRILANLRVTPNQVTAVGLVLSVLTAYLFFKGQFAAGLACAWLMALLDTVDGKLARVTLTSSKWGNIFDHGIDLIAPPIWWLAWWIGLSDHTDLWIAWSVWAVLGGHLAGKLIEQAFISTFALKVHIWRPFDSVFRLFTARRNPNLLILTAGLALGVPEFGYLAVAGWIAICFDVHTIRYIQAFIQRKKGLQIRSWME